jgi:putative DNA primase/helicase
MHLQRVSELTPEAYAWLWPGRLALGKLTMLDGDPGLGKSLLALDLCARLSTGRPMPDGSAGPGPANALVLEAEDGQKDTVRPRLEALGADLERVFVVRRGDLGELPRLPGQLAALDAALAEREVRLLVLDPVVAFLEPGVLTSQDPSVRRALLPLVQLAERRRCAVQLVRHLNKQANKRALYRGGGSIGLLGACRSGWLVAADPQAPGRRVLAQVKNNLAPPQPSLAFEVRPRAGAPPELVWLGESPRTADELVGAAVGAAAESPRDRARAFLEAFLQGGPRPTTEIWEAAVREKLSKRTLQRAREDLSIRCEWVFRDGVPRRYWLLPGQTAPLPPELEPWLRPLLEQFPPPNPLKEDE